MKIELLFYVIIIIYFSYYCYNNYNYTKKYVIALSNIIKNPKDDTAWCEKGKAQYYLKVFKGSIIYSLNNSLELNDKNFFAWYYKGKTLFRLKKFEESIQAFDKGIEIDAGNSSIWHCKGKALYNLKKYNDAIYAYDKAIEINPENILAWYDKGKVLYDLQKFEEAVIVYNKIFEINPEKSPLWYELETGSKILDSHWFRWWRKEYINKLQGLFKEKIERFEHLKSISPEQKDRIQQKIFISIGITSAYEAWVAFITKFKTWISSSFFFLIFQIILLTFWFQADRSALEWFFVILVIFMTLFIVEKIISLISLFSNMFSLVFLILISWISITMEFEWMPQVIHDGVGTAIVGMGAFLIWLLLSNSILALGIWVINRRKNKKYPEAVVVDSLCKTLDLTETESDKWLDIELKNNLLIELENIARRLENELPSKISSYDAVTDIWLKNCTRKIAMGIRKLKQHVLLPDDKSQEQLTALLSNRFVNAADENWDLFEQIDTPSIPNWRLRIFNILRRLVAIIFPLIIVLIVAIVPIPLNDSIMDYIIAGSIGWVAINILAWLDPDYQNKIETFKDKADILPSRKNK